MKTIVNINLALMVVSGSVLPASRLVRLAQMAHRTAPVAGLCMRSMTTAGSFSAGLKVCNSSQSVKLVESMSLSQATIQFRTLSLLKKQLESFRKEKKDKALLAALKTTQTLFAQPLTEATYKNIVELWHGVINVFLVGVHATYAEFHEKYRDASAQDGLNEVAIYKSHINRALQELPPQFSHDLKLK